MAWYRSSLKTGGGGGTNYPDLLAMAGGSTAFNLSDAVMHSQATKIPQFMFRGNTTIQEVNMAGITQVGEQSFYGATGITKVYLDSCTSIGNQAFYNIGSVGKLSSGVIYLPEVLTIGTEAFRNMQRQAQMMIYLAKCREIGNHAFRGGTTNIALTQKLELSAIQTIGQYAFGEHTIPTVDIGSTCNQIQQQAFYNGTITNLIIRRTTPPTLVTNLGTTPTHIYVPDGTNPQTGKTYVQEYQEANNWSQYASVIEAIPSEFA